MNQAWPGSRTSTRSKSVRACGMPGGLKSAMAMRSVSAPPRREDLHEPRSDVAGAADDQVLHRHPLVARRSRAGLLAAAALPDALATLESRHSATWRSGYEAACKAVYTGLIPVVAFATGPVRRAFGRSGGRVANESCPSFVPKGSGCVLDDRSGSLLGTYALRQASARGGGSGGIGRVLPGGVLDACASRRAAA